MGDVGNKVLCLIGLATLSVFNASVQAASSVDSGRDLFKRACQTCHSVEKGESHRQGPNLWGVVGRSAGSMTGFAYSSVFKSAQFKWDEKLLDQWLADPQDMLPGNVMTYAQRNPERRELIIEFLKTKR